MSQMKEMYEKVSASEELKAQFNAILQAAKEAGEEETTKKLLKFSKDQGFTITIAEFKEYFETLENQSKSELTDVELDMVAGGKSDGGKINVVSSVFSVGIYCALTSGIYEAANGQGGCGRSFE